MPYSIEEVLKIVNDNKSFFLSPLKHQNAFQAFYKTLDDGGFAQSSDGIAAMDAMDAIRDYSQQLAQILRDNQIDWPGPIAGQIQAIYFWRDLSYWTVNNIKLNPVFKIDAVCEFLMNNQEHPALTLWRENGGQVFVEHNGSSSTTLSQPQSVVYSQQVNMFDDITNRARLALEKVGSVVIENELLDAIISDSVFHIKTGEIGKYLYGRLNYIDNNQTPSFDDILVAYKSIPGFTFSIRFRLSLIFLNLMIDGVRRKTIQEKLWEINHPDDYEFLSGVDPLRDYLTKHRDEVNPVDLQKAFLAVSLKPPTAYSNELYATADKVMESAIIELGVEEIESRVYRCHLRLSMDQLTILSLIHI